MNFLKYFSIIFLVNGFAFAQEAKPIDVQFSHDPVAIKQGNTYYMFTTGKGIGVYSSTDFKNWKPEKSVFDVKPTWADQVVPNYDNHIWAPDIVFHNGLYYLYYSVSAFAKNTSAIGVTVNKTLDPKSKDFKWIDKGIVIQSYPNRDMWNAIDPQIIFDDNKVPYMAFGSFWDGLKMVKLNPDLISIAQPQEWHTIAKRERSFKLDDTDPGDAAIEAPFIFKKGKYYYQFASWDLCCRAEKSTYKVVVGRSEKLTGPYVDDKGIPMNEGGGKLVIEGNKNWFGAGHNSTYTFDGKDYMIFHAYDAKKNGFPVGKIKEITWQNDWPTVTPLD